MKISVIVSTYNQPAWLEKCVWGYAAQTHRDFELVVADDGSAPETARLVERLRRETGLGILHVWHEDRGFRKCEILNRAIRASGGDYLIFSDGDCIPRRDMVEVHASLADPGRYLSGGYLKVPAEVSARITREEILSGEFAELGWLRQSGWRPGHRALRLVRSRAMARIFDALTTTKPTFSGNNASAWREPILAANGFDAEMGYGGEDRALGVRLCHLGVRPKQIRHRAICIHLHHERPYVDPDVLRRNKEIIRRIRRNREVRARVGLGELSAEGAPAETRVPQREERA